MIPVPPAPQLFVPQLNQLKAQLLVLLLAQLPTLLQDQRPNCQPYFEDAEPIQDCETLSTIGKKKGHKIYRGIKPGTHHQLAVSNECLYHGQSSIKKAGVLSILATKKTR